MKRIILFVFFFILLHIPIPFILGTRKFTHMMLKLWAIMVLLLADATIFIIYSSQFKCKKLTRWLMFIGSVITFYLLSYGLSSIIWYLIIEKGQDFRWVYIYSALICVISVICTAIYIQSHLGLFRQPEEDRLPRMVLVPLLVISMFIAVIFSTAKSFQGGVLEQERALMGWMWVTIGAVTVSPLAFLLLRMMVRVASAIYEEEDDESNCFTRMCVFTGPYTVVYVPFVSYWAIRGILLMAQYYDKVIKNMQNPEFLIFNQVLLLWAVIPCLTLILLYLRADIIVKKAQESLMESNSESQLLNPNEEGSVASFAV